MFRRLLSVVIVGSSLGLLAGCQDMASEQPLSVKQPPLEKLKVPTEGFVKVQHVLIGFKGSIQGKVIERTEAEAKALADEILAKAKAGEDFDALVVKHTDDSPPGIYVLGDAGVDTMMYPGQAFRRGDMVKGFSDVAFSLKPGEFGVSEYEKKASPFGWHVIRRIE